MPVNVLPNRPKISDLTKERSFLTQFVLDELKTRIKVQPCRLQQFLRPVNTLIPEGCSETGAFGHSRNNMFWSP